MTSKYCTNDIVSYGLNFTNVKIIKFEFVFSTTLFINLDKTSSGKKNI